MRVLPTVTVVRVSFLVLLAACAGSTAPAAFADDILVVVPNSKENAGGIGNIVPFSYPPARYQQLNFAAEFGAITGPTLITEIAFRAGPTANPFTHTVADLQINLSTAAVTPLSGTYATNVGSDDTTVFAGPLVMNVVSPKSSLRPWEILIPLTTPFLYDPSVGDLLLDVRIIDNPSGVAGRFIDSLTIPQTLARVFCDAVPNCSVDDTGGGGLNGGIDGGFLITRFTFAPEPGAGAAGAIAVLALGTAAKRWARACPS
jgi:hypothetical protein